MRFAIAMVCLAVMRIEHSSAQPIDPASIWSNYQGGAPAPIVACSTMEEPIERAKCLDPAVADAVAEYERAEAWAEEVITDGQRFWYHETSEFEVIIEDCNLTNKTVGDGRVRSCIVEKLGDLTGDILRLFAANIKKVAPFSAMITENEAANKVCETALRIDGPDANAPQAKWTMKAVHGESGDAVHVFVAESNISLRAGEPAIRLFWLHRDEFSNHEDWFVAPSADSADRFNAEWTKLIGEIETEKKRRARPLMAWSRQAGTQLWG